MRLLSRPVISFQAHGSTHPSLERRSRAWTVSAIRLMSSWEVSEVHEDGTITPNTSTPLASEQPDGRVLEERHHNGNGGVRVLRLQRPQVLNALTTTMCRRIRARVPALFATDVNCVILRGSGPKAFCAGGDVRRVYELGPSAGAEFFAEEYQMDCILGETCSPNSIVSIIDGITMGGGVGLSVHGRFRVATERTVMAMPECAIGLHPDVGMSYVLPRLPGQVGLYMALTGARLKGIDTVRAGLATHFVPSSQVDELVDSLGALKSATNDEVDTMIRRFETNDAEHARSSPAELTDRAKIDRLFASSTVEGLVDRLEKEAAGGLEKAFAARALEAVRAGSPTSVMVSFASLTSGGHRASLRESLRMDFRLSMHCIASRDRDFYEGVRSKLVDKDGNPKWNQPGSADQIASYFKPLTGFDEILS